jgi:CubicO group peptidase (beta-lactamase class C family)
MATLLLADKGQISREDEISRHLPDCPDSAAGITVKHLIHHTSGLRSDLVLLLMAGWRLEDVITNDDVIRLSKRQKNLKFSPGERFCYSGTGYLLLASMIEHVSGQSLSMFCGEQIFKPLGMESTHFHDDYLKIVKNRAYAYCRSMEGSYSKAVLSCGLVGGTGLLQP